jgi:hypothetical protein
MRMLAEHPDLRRQYEQIVASDPRFGFFAQVWVQDCLHLQWQYILNQDERILFRIPVLKKWGLSAYLQPLFIRSLDIIGSDCKEDLAALLAFLKKSNFLHLNITLSKDLQFPLAKGKFQVLQLGKPIDELRQGYAENIKRSLKKAKELKLAEVSYASFQTFFIAQKGENLGNLNAAAWERLEKLVALAQTKETAYCFGAFDQEQLVAAGLFFKWQDQLYFMKGTLNKDGKKVGALAFLIDAVLEKFSLNFQTLDFIGSNQESIAAFYRKFGAIDQTYGIVKGRIPLV